MTTIRNIAKSANVSVATVSNYLNGTHAVSQEKQQRIEDAIQSLGYVRNRAATQLRRHKSDDIAVILPDLGDFYYAQALRGIEKTLRDQNYNISFGFTYDDPDAENSSIERFLGMRVAGMLLFTCQPENHALFRRISKTTSLVLLDRVFSCSDACVVNIRRGGAIRFLAERCLKDGLHDIALFAGRKGFWCEDDCEDGYRQAFAEQGREVNERMIFHTAFSKETAFFATVELLKQQIPHAILTTCENGASGVMEALKYLGHASDVRLYTLGTDTWNTTESTIGLPAITIGVRAAKALSRHLSQGEKIEGARDIIEIPGLISKEPLRCHCARSSLNILMPDFPYIQSFIGLAPHFEKQTGHRVSIDAIPLNDIYQYLKRDTKHDVLLVDHPWMFEMVRSGDLIDITPYLENSAFAKDNYILNCLNQMCLLNGRYYSLPFVCMPQILYYRKDLFNTPTLRAQYQKATGARLTPPRTFREYNTVARFFSRRFNAGSPTPYGCMFTGAFGECFAAEFYPRFVACGGKILGKFGNVTFDSPQTLEAYALLRETLEYAPEDAHDIDNGDAVRRFLSGESAMLITFRSPMSEIVGQPSSLGKQHIGFAQIPGRVPLFGGWCMGVSRHCTSADAAMEFVEWACGTQIAPYMTILTGQSVIGKIYDNDEQQFLYPWLSLYKKAFSFTHTMRPHVTSRGEAVSQKDINSVLIRCFEEIVKNGAAPEKAIQEGAKRLQTLYFT